MLGHELVRVFTVDGYQCIPLGGDDADIRSYDETWNAVRESAPDLIINAAAYTAVDAAEGTGSSDNYDVNAIGAYHLAKAASTSGADFITYSTDYVFDGTKADGYLPSDQCAPVSAYGIAKKIGERLASSEHPQSIIVRTSWLYGELPTAKHFVRTILRLAREKGLVRVVNDQRGKPTNAADLALATLRIAEDIGNYRGKILHLSNETESVEGITWYDFATEIVRLSGLDARVEPCSTSEYPTPAKRPEHSALTNDSPIGLPFWKDSLEAYMRNI